MLSTWSPISAQLALMGRLSKHRPPRAYQVSAQARQCIEQEVCLNVYGDGLLEVSSSHLALKRQYSRFFTTRPFMDACNCFLVQPSMPRIDFFRLEMVQSFVHHCRQAQCWWCHSFHMKTLSSSVCSQLNMHSASVQATFYRAAKVSQFITVCCCLQSTWCLTPLWRWTTFLACPMAS